MKNGILKDVSVITVSKVASSLISFVNLALLSRFRTLSEYGTYSEMLLTVSLIITICDLGLPYAVTYFGSKAAAEDDRRHFFSIFYTIDTAISIFIGVAILFAIPLIEKYFDNPQISKYWYFLMLLPWVRIIDGTIDNVLVILKKTMLIAGYRLLYGVMIFLVIITVQKLGLGFDEYLIAYTCLIALLTILAYFIVSKNLGGLKMAFDKKIFVEIFKYAIPIGLASAVGIINVEFDKLIIGHLCTVDEVAIYANASKGLPISLVASSISMVIMPVIIRRVSEGKNQNAATMWGDSIIISMDMVVTLAFALIVFAPEVITFMYSEKYLDGVSIFRIYSIGSIWSCTYWGTILNAKGKTNYILYGSIISCIINIVSDIVLFKFLGMIGPAIATVFSQTCLLVFQYLLSKKVLEVKHIINWSWLTKIIIRNTIIAAVFYFIRHIAILKTNINNVVLAFVIGSLWMIFYLVVYGMPILKNINSLNSEKTNE